MSRPLTIWLTFAICLAVVLAAMGWVSLTAVRLDRAEQKARQQALTEERIRLALWRLDSALAPILAQESAQSFLAYRAFLPADPAPGGMSLPANKTKWTASPLLTSPADHVLLYFQIGPDGTFSSPQVPSGPFCDAAGLSSLDPKRVEKARKLLTQLAGEVNRQAFLELLPEQPPPVEAESISLLAPSATQRAANRDRLATLQQRGQDSIEFNFRNELITNNAAVQSQRTLGQSDAVQRMSLVPSAVISAPMTPLWIEGRLVLARRIAMVGGEYVQGCVFDWPAIKRSLLETIADLLPGADLQPVTTAAAGDEESRRLAALPVRLVPGATPNGIDLAGSPIVLSLAAAWACMLAAVGAVAALLWGVLRLSERRAAFVSAVTHELRTPLTTLQMYAEMLTEGMTPDVEQQQHYLHTLRAEAARLAHLVENVLAYARLERGRPSVRAKPIALEKLIVAAEDRLALHTEQAGMTLVTEDIAQDGAIMVLANPSAVEQVLLNLVDNACKYALAASDKRIHLAVRLSANKAEILVRDHGPGVAPTVRRRLFRSFSKSAEEAAQSAPGVGLGLALSRRLARDMSGDLRLDPNVVDGAQFVLSLPRA